ncbi:MAG TPA: AraC family transcriptional regulator [Polyangiaceae bacterium]|jgi:AraC-like DNA-binding protein
MARRKRVTSLTHATATLCCVKLDLPREREFDAGVWYSTRASTWYPTHYHDELEVKLVLWGSTVYRIGAETIALKAGSLLWFAPGREHALLTVSGDLAMWVTSFRARTARAAEKACGTRLLDDRRGWGICSLPLARVAELSTLHAELAPCNDPPLANALAERLLTRTITSSVEYGPRAVPATTDRGRDAALHSAVARARELLSTPHADLSLEYLARRCGLDSFRLSRVFKQQMGLSIVQFRNHFRVQEFIARFGRGGGRNMLEVALDAGFGSYPQFHRAFHQVAGYAPSEHLRRVRAGIVFPSQQALDARRWPHSP